MRKLKDEEMTNTGWPVLHPYLKSVSVWLQEVDNDPQEDSNSGCSHAIRHQSLPAGTIGWEMLGGWWRNGILSGEHDEERWVESGNWRMLDGYWVTLRFRERVGQRNSVQKQRKHSFATFDFDW